MRLDRLFLTLMALSLLFALPGCDIAVEGDEAGECDDGVDNDQDGTTDCADDGCAAAGVCAGDDDGEDDDGDGVTVEAGDCDDDDPIAGRCGSLFFSGEASHVDVLNAATFVLPEMTVEAWVYPNSFDPNESNSNVVSTSEWTSDGSARGYDLYVGNGIAGFKVGSQTEETEGWSSVRGVSTLPLEGWTHLAGQISGGQIALYVNGDLQGYLDVGEVRDPAFRLRIGDNPQDGGPTVQREFHGLIDDVRVSSVARYTSNFTPARRHSPDGDTVGLWHFDEGTEDTAHDSSGAGRHGSIVAAGWSSAHP